MSRLLAAIFFRSARTSRRESRNTAAETTNPSSFCVVSASRRVRARVAAPATGRGGTNALYLSPPDAIEVHFGDDSLRKFERDAVSRGVLFELFEAAELALDLDEPSDLAILAARS